MALYGDNVNLIKITPIVVYRSGLPECKAQLIMKEQITRRRLDARMM